MPEMRMATPVNGSVTIYGIVLFSGAGLVPVDDANQIPVVLIELKLKLTLFVDDQLGSRVKNAGALVFVGIVQVEFAGRQVEGPGCRVVTSFDESDRAVGGEANFAARVGTDQANISEVSANGAGDGNSADGLHLFERVDQALILALLKGIDEDCSVFLSRELRDNHFDVDRLT
jgi:hypothetical protein